jgi:hypothetical protein
MINDTQTIPLPIKDNSYDRFLKIDIPIEIVEYWQKTYGLDKILIAPDTAIYLEDAGVGLSVMSVFNDGSPAYWLSPQWYSEFAMIRRIKLLAFI